MDLVSIDQIEAARDLLSDVVRKTPMEHARDLARLHNGDVYLKCETLQRTGSFKIRGAYTRIHGLTATERERGVVAVSAGNHAQGVALAASLIGTRATVFMPERAPLPKVAATRSYGAEVHLVGTELTETFAAATAFAEREESVFIHPFDHPDIIAGQGTVGLEILDQVPDAATVIVPTGGGGLLAGVGAAMAARRPDVKVVGVQASGAAAYPPSLAAGHPVPLGSTNTMADGIAVGQLGEVSFGHVSSLANDVVTVSEESLSRAVLLCLERRKLVVEPAGAAGVAALLEHPRAFQPPIVSILSGGNVDPLLLLRIIRHGMTAGGRYLSLRLRVRDRPGSLGEILTTVGKLGANVLDVEHSRTAGALELEEVEVSLNLETRGPEHRAQVAAELQNSGYTVIS